MKRGDIVICTCSDNKYLKWNFSYLVESVEFNNDGGARIAVTCDDGTIRFFPHWRFDPLFADYPPGFEYCKHQTKSTKVFPSKLNIDASKITEDDVIDFHFQLEEDIKKFRGIRK